MVMVYRFGAGFQHENRRNVNEDGHFLVKYG